MSETFLYSDPHFGHKLMTRAQDDGSVLRPFTSPEAMDEALVALYNERVRSGDTVIFLGDVAINRRCLPTIARLNGHKILVRGNHDQFRLEEYARHFKDVVGTRLLAKEMFLSHYPVHPDSMYPSWTNVHGHMHHRFVRLSDGTPDPRYLCVCVEQTNFAPITIGEVRERIKKQSDEATGIARQILDQRASRKAQGRARSHHED